MCTVKSLKKIGKSLKLYGSRKAQELCSDADSQSELTVERPKSFIGPSVAEIHGAYLELNLSQTRVQHGTRVHVWMHQHDHILKVASFNQLRAASLQQLRAASQR